MACTDAFKCRTCGSGKFKTGVDAATADKLCADRCGFNEFNFCMQTLRSIWHLASVQRAAYGHVHVPCLVQQQASHIHLTTPAAQHLQMPNTCSIQPHLQYAHTFLCLPRPDLKLSGTHSFMRLYPPIPPAAHSIPLHDDSDSIVPHTMSYGMCGIFALDRPDGVYALPESADCAVYLTCCSGLGFQRQCKDWFLAMPVSGGPGGCVHKVAVHLVRTFIKPEGVQLQCRRCRICPVVPAGHRHVVCAVLSSIPSLVLSTGSASLTPICLSPFFSCGIRTAVTPSMHGTLPPAGVHASQWTGCVCGRHISVPGLGRDLGR